MTHTNLDNNSKFRIAIKSINDIMVLNGLVPSLLVFGTFLSLPAPSTTNRNQIERFNALTIALAEMETIVAQTRIKNRTQKQSPPPPPPTKEYAI